MTEVRQGKLVLSLANTPLAEVEVHEDTHTLTCSMLSLPKTWVGGKVAQKKYLDEAKRKLAEAQNTVSDARVEAASKAVKDLKKAAREKGVGLTADPAAPIRNSQIGKLTVMAADAIRSVYLPAYVAHKAEKAEEAVGGDRQIQMMLDSGTNVCLGSHRALQEKKVELDKLDRYNVTGIENKPRPTLGRNISPLRYEMLDTRGEVGEFSYTGQITDMNDTVHTHKFLLDVVNDLVGVQHYEVVFRRNKRGQCGHFLRKEGSDRLFPIHLNAERLPVLPIKGFKYAWESRPDSIHEYVDQLLDSTTGNTPRESPRHVSAVSREVERQLSHVLEEAADSDTTSDSWEDDEYASDSQRIVHARRKGGKVRRKAARTLLNRADVHRILHRGKRQTHATFGRSCYKMVASDGKVVTGDTLTPDDFEEACDTCAVTRAKADPTNRKGKVHVSAASASE